MYPTTQVTWSKEVLREAAQGLVSDSRVLIDSYQESPLHLVSRLTISSVDESDTAVYSCHAAGEYKVSI